MIICTIVAMTIVYNCKKLGCHLADACINVLLFAASRNKESNDPAILEMESVMINQEFRACPTLLND